MAAITMCPYLTALIIVIATSAFATSNIDLHWAGVQSQILISNKCSFVLGAAILKRLCSTQIHSP